MSEKGKEKLDEKRKEKLDENHRPPLPPHLLSLRKKTHAVYVSNLPHHISKPELEAMFYRVRRIADPFIPTDKNTGNKRGFAFVRFSVKEVADRAISMINGRSWGGKWIPINQAHPLQEPSTSSPTAQPPPAPLSIWSPRCHSQASLLGGVFSKSFARVVAPSHSSTKEAWTTFNGSVNGVRVALSVVKKRKEKLQCGLVGFLKSKKDCLQRTEFWINSAGEGS